MALLLASLSLQDAIFLSTQSRIYKEKPTIFSFLWVLPLFKVYLILFGPSTMSTLRTSGCMPNLSK